MTIQQLQVFLALSKTMNYTLASQELFMTRQAVRQNISTLESDLGATLIQNDHNHLTLSPLGILLNERAPAVLSQFEKLQTELLEIIQDNEPITLAISSAAIPSFLPGLAASLEAFEQSYPKIKINKIIDANDQIAALVRSGQAGAGIVLDIGSGCTGMNRYPLTSHPTAILVPRGHKLWGISTLTISDLDGTDLFLPGTGDEFAPFLDLLRQHETQVNIHVENSFYQVYYNVHEYKMLCIDRYMKSEQNNPDFEKDLILKGAPPFCSSLITDASRKQSPGGKLLINHLLQASIQNRLVFASTSGS